jgi:hypothetical protein
MNVTINVLHGALRLRRFIVAGIGQVEFPDLTEIAPGKSRQFEVRASG